MTINTDANMPATANGVGEAFVRLKLFNGSYMPAVSERSLMIAQTMYKSVSDDYHCKMGFLSNTEAYYKKHGYFKGYTSEQKRIALFNAYKEDFLDIMDSLVESKGGDTRTDYISELLASPVDVKDLCAINDSLESNEASLGASQSLLCNQMKVALVDKVISHALAVFRKAKSKYNHIQRFEKEAVALKYGKESVCKREVSL